MRWHILIHGDWIRSQSSYLYRLDIQGNVKHFKGAIWNIWKILACVLTGSVEKETWQYDAFGGNNWEETIMRAFRSEIWSSVRVCWLRKWCNKDKWCTRWRISIIWFSDEPIQETFLEPKTIINWNFGNRKTTEQKWFSRMCGLSLYC